MIYGLSRIQSESVDNAGEHILYLLFEARMGGSNSHVSHTIFQISPANKQWLFSKCQYGYVSRWAFDVFLEQFGTREADAIANFYRRISTVPAAGSLRGHLFEKQTLNHLCGIHDASEFWIRRLTDSNRRAWTCRGPVERLDTLESEFPEAITKAVGKPKPLHLIPLAHNFWAVDSILYDLNDLEAVLTFILIMVKDNHPIVVSGLQLIQCLLNIKKNPLFGDLHPNTTKLWCFLFIVPSRKESTFKVQRLLGDTAMFEWAKKVDQYVLGLEDQTIFGTTKVVSVQVDVDNT